MSALGSFLIYSLILIGIGIYAYRAIQKTSLDRFVEEFYAGGRALGSVVVAVLIAAGLASAGTFIAGPGMCYEYGLSWVHLNNLQTFMNLLLLGVIGIPVGISARRVKAATFLDLIKARYKSRILVILLALITFILLVPYMSTQFVGAARVIVQMTGVKYITALMLGVLVVVVYTVAGGMKGNTLALIVQGVVMTVGAIVLLIGTIVASGGTMNATKTIVAQNISLLTPTGPGDEFGISIGISLAGMIGFFIVGMPHAILGALSYKNTIALKRGIWIGAVLVFVWTFFLCLAGTLGRALIPNLEVADEIAPWLAMQVLPGWLAGVVLAGIVAGIQTTVASMALVVSSAVAKNLVEEIRPEVSASSMRSISRWVTVGSLTIAALLAITEPPLIQWIILFSIGGLESGCFALILLGLYWRRGNSTGALCSLIAGIAWYALGNYIPCLTLGFLPAISAVVISVIIYIIVSLLTEPPSSKVISIFFGSSDY